MLNMVLGSEDKMDNQRTPLPSLFIFNQDVKSVLNFNTNIKAP